MGKGSSAGQRDVNSPSIFYILTAGRAQTSATSQSGDDGRGQVHEQGIKVVKVS